ncbi:RNA polymerase sigma factor FecI [Escherichia coli]|uniref:RNA polymerase sigma factor FecI n=1 Tax=Escherichia coli TaxID=562 RepID=UPI003985D70C
MSDRATTTASLTFESLYGTHHGWLKSWLTRKLQSAFDADDIAQDTFLRVMVSAIKAETLSTIRDPRSFLCTIAKRVMVDLFRRNALEKAYLEMLALMPEGGAPSPEERESQLETLQLLDSMLDGLNGKTREAFLLSQLDGLTYSEIAHKLGVSISSVKKYVAKAVEHCLLFRLEYGL